MTKIQHYNNWKEKLAEYKRSDRFKRRREMQALVSKSKKAKKFAFMIKKIKRREKPNENSFICKWEPLDFSTFEPEEYLRIRFPKRLKSYLNKEKRGKKIMKRKRTIEPDLNVNVGIVKKRKIEYEIEKKNTKREKISILPLEPVFTNVVNYATNTSSNNSSDSEETTQNNFDFYDSDLPISDIEELENEGIISDTDEDSNELYTSPSSPSDFIEMEMKNKKKTKRIYKMEKMLFVKHKKETNIKESVESFFKRKANSWFSPTEARKLGGMIQHSYKSVRLNLLKLFNEGKLRRRKKKKGNGYLYSIN